MTDTDSEHDFRPRTLINPCRPRPTTVFLEGAAEFMADYLACDSVDFVCRQQGSLIVNYRDHDSASDAWQCTWTWAKLQGFEENVRKPGGEAVAVLGRPRPGSKQYEVVNAGVLYHVHAEVDPGPAPPAPYPCLTTLMFLNANRSSASKLAVLPDPLGVDFIEVVTSGEQTSVVMNFREPHMAMIVWASVPTGRAVRWCVAQGAEAARASFHERRELGLGCVLLPTGGDA